MNYIISICMIVVKQKPSRKNFLLSFLFPKTPKNRISPTDSEILISQYRKRKFFQFFMHQIAALATRTTVPAANFWSNFWS